MEKEHASDHLTDRIATGASGCVQVQLRKKFFPEWLTRVDLGAVYETNADEVKYVVGAKKSFELSDDGLLSLDIKASYGCVCTPVDASLCGSLATQSERRDSMDGARKAISRA